MHLSAEIDRVCRGAARMAATAKSWSWKEIPNWWPVIAAIVALVFAAAQVSARVGSSDQLNLAQDERLQTLEKAVNEMSVTSARVDERTASMQTQLNRMETKLN